jgi:hypothetical protein
MSGLHIQYPSAMVVGFCGIIKASRGEWGRVLCLKIAQPSLTRVLQPLAWEMNLVRENWSILRATSHTRLKVLDHGNVRALVGQKGGDRLSSLHTRR